MCNLTILNFGKYKGESLYNVYHKDSKYIRWCFDNDIQNLKNNAFLDSMWSVDETRFTKKIVDEKELNNDGYESWSPFDIDEYEIDYYPQYY